MVGMAGMAGLMKRVERVRMVIIAKSLLQSATKARGFTKWLELDTKARSKNAATAPLCFSLSGSVFL